MSARTKVKACAWKWEDIEAELEEARRRDPVSPGRAAVSLVNTDTGEALGPSRTMNALVQMIEPDSHGAPHRHSNYAIFIVKSGHGHSVVDGETLEWSDGDVFFAPPWARHQHFNDSKTDNAVMYTVQNVPTTTNMGTWFFKGSDDGELVHNVK